MGIVRFFFSCITQAIKIAIGVAITIGLFFAAGYLVDMFAATKTAPPGDPRLQPYADRGMPLSGAAQTDKPTSLYLSFFETLLNKKPDVMPPADASKKHGALQTSASGVSKQQSPPADNRTSGAARPPLLQTAEDKKQPAPSSAQSETLTYTLQLGSFQNSEVAAAFSSSLAAKGYEAHIVKITVPDKGVVYRVRIGKYKNLEEAQKMAAELEKKENISAFITSK
jgi:cell division septation protein DedD